MLHKEVLSKKQEKALPLIQKFRSDFYLAGGTAIALHLGHRRSIDFDLFTKKKFSNFDLRRKISEFGKIKKVLIDKKDEYTVIVGGIKITFLLYDFKISHEDKVDSIIRLPNLLTLAAMKAYALGRRAKWKDYVDLFFVMRNYHSLAQICQQAEKIFGAEFNEKNFRVQLSYFKDIDYSEKVDYLKGFEVSDAQIKIALKAASLS